MHITLLAKLGIAAVLAVGLASPSVSLAADIQPSSGFNTTASHTHASAGIVP